MKALNLDTHFQPTSNMEYVQYGCMYFNGGEYNIKLENITSLEGESVLITQRIYNADDTMEILIANDALRRAGVKNVELYIPYVPYARQDRVMVNGESLSIKVFAQLINTCGFDAVYTLDNHSDVSTALIDNCHNITNHTFVHDALTDLSPHSDIDDNLSHFTLISPDAGANKKAHALSESLGGIPIVKCDKTRDVTNGSITGFEVYSNDLKGATCVIVDDIISGGGTFIGLAEELRNKNAGKLHLVVTHCESEYGINRVLNHFDSMHTTNSLVELSKIESLIEQPDKVFIHNIKY